MMSSTDVANTSVPPPPALHGNIYYRVVWCGVAGDGGVASCQLRLHTRAARRQSGALHHLSSPAHRLSCLDAAFGSAVYAKAILHRSIFTGKAMLVAVHYVTASDASPGD